MELSQQSVEKVTKAEFEPVFIDRYLEEIRKPKKLWVEDAEPELPAQIEVPISTVDPLKSQWADASFLGGLSRPDAPSWARKTARIYYGWASVVAVVLLIAQCVLALLQVFRGKAEFSSWLGIVVFQLPFAWFLYLIARHVFRYTPPVFRDSSEVKSQSDKQ